MTRNILVFGLASILTIGLGSSAFAAHKAIPAQQASVKDALGSMKVGIADERVVFNKYGRQDLVLSAQASKADLVKELRRAYTSSRVIDGYRVRGYAHSYATDNWNFTMEKKGQMYVVEVGAADAGSTINIWGITRSRDMKPMPAKPVNRKTLR
jgi:hypothetical protein